MRKILTIALALTMCASVSMADNIGLYSDAAGTNCALNPANFSLATVYVVHTLNSGAKATKFKVNNALGLTPTGNSVTTGYLSIGTFEAGIEITWPTCTVGNHVLGTMGFFKQLEVMDCTRTAEVVPHATSEVPGFVITVDCSEPFGTIETATGGRLFGGSDSAACGGCNAPLAASEKTWGSIKALYR